MVALTAFIGPDHSFDTEIGEIPKHPFGKELSGHPARTFIIACQIGVSNASVMVVLQHNRYVQFFLQINRIIVPLSDNGIRFPFFRPFQNTLFSIHGTVIGREAIKKPRTVLFGILYKTP